MVVAPTKTRWRSQRWLSAAFAVAIGLLIVNVLFTIRNIKAMTTLSKLVTRTHEVVKRLDDVHSELLTAEVRRSAYLSTGREADYQAFQQKADRTRDCLVRLAWVLGKVGARHTHFDSVKRAVGEELRAMEALVRARRDGRTAADLAKEWNPGVREEVERQIDLMTGGEAETRRDLQEALNAAFTWTILAFLIASALALILLLGVQYLSVRSRRRLTLQTEWLATTLLSIGDAVIATDSSGRVGFMNRIAEDLTGWCESDAVGRSLGEVFVILDESTRKPADNPVARVLATGTIQGLANHTVLVAKGGVERPIDDSAAPIRIQGGPIRGVVLVFRDVTREKAAAQEQDRLNRELREKDVKKNEFLAMLAHELRNPLAAIGNAVMLSSNAELREHLDWSLDVIRRQIHHLSRLIDDLLDVSRISHGKIELRCESLNIWTVVRYAVEMVRPMIDEKNHALELSVEDESALWVDGDPMRLEQIFVNLLSNAAKYTGEGGMIEVAGRLDGDAVVVEVSDDGAGIPAEKIPEMFELFVQGDRSLARSEGGLGIGLTVVKNLVELHNGKITAESGGPGAGSRFTIRLPAVKPPPEPPPAPAETSSRLKGSHVLVVDDNVDTVLGLSRILTFLGLRVSTAHNGPDAIETAKRTRPEFILLDIGLPGMDGYEVARRLRREDCGRDAVIVAVTGYGHEADRDLSLKFGFDHHLVKPLNHDALATILSRGGRASMSESPIQTP